jgi:hypothetical protein
MQTKPSSEDILNAILPPREWIENGKNLENLFHLTFNFFFLKVLIMIDFRKALHPVCESLTCIQS